MDLLQSLITAGVASAVIGAVVALVRMAVGGDRRRADDWKEAAQAHEKANEILSGNLEKLINTVEQMANSQREATRVQLEMMVLVQKVAANRSPP